MRFQTGAVFVRLFGRHVRHQNAVYTRRASVARQVFQTVLKNRIEVGEKNQGRGRLLSNLPHGFQIIGQTVAVPEGAFRGALNRGPVGQRIRERDAQLDNMGPRPFQLRNEVDCHFQIGIARRNEGNERLLSLPFQLLEFPANRRCHRPVLRDKLRCQKQGDLSTSVRNYGNEIGNGA